MQDDSLRASVQYGDYTGTAKADRHDQRDLSDLAEKYGVDTDRYFVFGVNVYIGETHRDKLARALVSILAIDTHVVEAASVDLVQDFVDSHQGELPYLSFEIPATLEDVLLSFKRFNLVLCNSYIERVHHYRRTLESDLPS